MAEKAIETYKNIKVYSLGPLIHNEIVLSNLKKRGLEIVDEKNIQIIEENSVVIIRAHGIPPKLLDILNSKKCIIIDATCPRVKASQKMVKQYTSENDYVILSGDKNHGEVISIAGYAGKNFYQIQNKVDAENLEIKNSPNINVILLSQTTFSISEFEEIKEICKKKFKNLDVFNTICPATQERQDALLDLCKQVDGIIVVGGKNSANTKRLYQRAKENCKNVIHIENACEIDESFYNLESVGITAGASTPDLIIEEVEKALSVKIIKN